MAFVVQFRKWGKSRCVCVPSLLTKQLQWKIGDVLQISVRDGVLIVQPVVLPKPPHVTKVEQEALVP